MEEALTERIVEEWNSNGEILQVYLMMDNCWCRESEQSESGETTWLIVCKDGHRSDADEPVNERQEKSETMG